MAIIITVSKLTLKAPLAFRGPMIIYSLIKIINRFF